MLVVLSIAVLLLVVFPACLYGVGWLIQATGRRAPQAQAQARPSTEVPQWLQRPPVSWKKTFF